MFQLHPHRIVFKIVALLVSVGLTAPSPAREPKAAERLLQAQEHYTKAMQFEDRGQMQLALSEYDLALKAKPGNSASILGRARCYSALGLNARALGDLETLTKTEPKNIRAWLNLASVCINAGEFDRALKATESALNLDHDSVAATRLLAEIAFHNEQYETAANVCTRLIAVDPGSRNAYFMLLRCARKIKAPMDDIANIIEAAQKNLPTDGELFFTMGRYCRGASSFELGSDADSQTIEQAQQVRNRWLELAETCVTSAIAAQPNNATYRAELVRTLVKEHKKSEAAHQVAIARRLAPLDPETIALSKTVGTNRNDLAAEIKNWLRSLGSKASDEAAAPRDTKQ